MTFERAYDKAWQALAKTLGRDPSSDEAELLEGQLFERWIGESRFDELIAHLLSTYGREGGHSECVVLCAALRKTNDVTRIERLLGGLISRRERRFWASWPKASEGQVGAMREAASAMAAAIEAHAERFHNFWALGLTEEMEAARAAMLRLQSRTRASRR